MADEVVVQKRRGRPRKNQLPEDAINKIVEKEKKARGRNLPIDFTPTATSSEMSEMLRSILRWYNQPQIRTDEECAERLENYFNTLAETGELPTVEKMALALGVTRACLWNWENGIQCSPARAAMIRQAKGILAAMDAELVSQGKIPQVTYIFRAKNFYGMKDQTDVVVTPNNPVGAVLPEEELRKRIEGDVVVEPDAIDADITD